MSSANNTSGRKVQGDTIRSRSGKTIHVNQNLSDRLRASKHAREAKRAKYLSTLPKNPFLRVLYRLHPKRVLGFWFSAEGAIMALKVLGVGTVIVFILTIGVFAYFRKDLPKIKDISGDTLDGSITYYDRTGKKLLWQDYDAVKRIPVASTEIAPYMKMATVAIEDREFYTEGAFNFTAIVRAALHDVFHVGQGLQGASTITQQLVKLNEQWTDNRTFNRKIKELILAVELSREYSKDDILTGYLNIAPFGGVEYGVEAAARDYFHTDANKLTLAQASMLAAIPQSPSYFSPYASTKFNKAATANLFDEEGLIDRQHHVLDAMVELGMINQTQADAAKAVDIMAQVQPLTSKYNGIKAPWFVLAAKQELLQKYGEQIVQHGGWKVTTTLDMRLQNKAENLVNTNAPRILGLTYGAADEEAMVAEDVPTGQIVALVGGTNFYNKNHGQNNYAAGILIPPGSSFKPYDYSAFIDGNKDVGAGSVLFDKSGPIPGYPCTHGTDCLHDYDFFQPGPLTLRYALGGSRNIPAVKAMMSSVPNDTSPGYVASINNTIAVASAMMDNPYQKTTYNCYSDVQNTQPTQCYGAAAIGDGAFLRLDDHVNGLSTLGRLGAAIPRTYILQIADSSGKVVYHWQQPQAKQVINKDTAYIVDDMASDPRASYLGGSCTDYSCVPGVGAKFHRYKGWHFAIKTGTTNFGYDGLMTSWSTKYAVVTWVGNHNRDRALNTFMENLTGPLAAGFMEFAHNNLKPVNWKKPADVKILPAFVVAKHIHYGEQTPSPAKDLFPSWYTPPSSTTGPQTIDKVSGKTATSCTPALAQQKVSNSNASGFSVDKFVTGGLGGSTLAGKDDVHSCDDSPPSITLTAPSVCDGTLGGCTITFTVTQGTHPLSDSQYPKFPGTVTISVDGHKVESFDVSDSPSSGSFNYTPTDTETGATITATVTDSVLYSAEDSRDVDLIAGP